MVRLARMTAGGWISAHATFRYAVDTEHFRKFANSLYPLSRCFGLSLSTSLVMAVSVMAFLMWWTNSSQVISISRFESPSESPRLSVFLFIINSVMRKAPTCDVNGSPSRLVKVLSVHTKGIDCCLMMSATALAPSSDALLRRSMCRLLSSAIKRMHSLISR